MNIVKPELIWVDGRCYRSLDDNECSNRRAISPYVEDSSYVDYKDSEEDRCDDNIEIIPHHGTKFKLTYHVAKSFFPFIVGSKHAVRKKLETETGTVIHIPKVGEDGNLVIIGSDQRNIITAYRRITLLKEGARKKLKPTHFLSIPLNEEYIITQFNVFKNEVLTKSGKLSMGVDETIFTIPSKLHLTIGVMTLLDDMDKNQAIEALNYCKEHIVKPAIGIHGQIPIYIQGTDIMNDDCSQVRVLYAKIINKCELLQETVDKIANYYKKIGLVVRFQDRVKLHVTLMKVKISDVKIGDTEPGSCEVKACNKTSTFDATEIMKVHENTFFGETTLKDIHLSQRGTISSTGYYEATAKMNLLEI